MSTTCQEVKIFDQHVELKIGGVDKVLSIASFKESLDTSLNSEVTVPPMIMPRNCIIFGRSGNSIELNTYWPGVVFDIEFKVYGVPTPKKFRIPFPNVLIYFLLKSSGERFGVHSAKYFCTPYQVGQLFQANANADFIKSVNVDRKIYPLGLPNVFADCRACYGGNSMPTGFINDLRGLDWFYLFLKNSPFNNDLSVPGAKGSYRDSSYLINALNGKEVYPYTDIFGDGANVEHIEDY